MTLNPSDYVCVSTATLNLSEIAAKVADPRAGAISTFAGTTRDNHFGETAHLAASVYVQFNVRAESFVPDK